VNEVIESQQSNLVIKSDKHPTDTYLQPDILEDCVHDFDSLLSWVKGCALGESVTAELKNLCKKIFPVFL